MGTGGTPGVRAAFEEEELDLRVRVEREAQVGGLGQRPLQHVARVGEGRRAVGEPDVTEHPGAARRLRAPRQHLEGSGVGLGQHVRLGDAGEALDRRPVEPDPLDEGPLEFGRRDGHRFEETEHVGEPQTHEPDVALLEGPEHEFLLFIHELIVPGRCFQHVTNRWGTKRTYGTSEAFRWYSATPLVKSFCPVDPHPWVFRGTSLPMISM